MGVNNVCCPSCEYIGDYGWYFGECVLCNDTVCNDCRNAKYQEGDFKEDDEGNYIKPNDYYCKNCDKIKAENEKQEDIFELINRLKISKKNKTKLKNYINNI